MRSNWKGESSLSDEVCEIESHIHNKQQTSVANLVESGVVSGFDDPQLATLSGLRRRGVPSSSIVEFVNSIGVAKVSIKHASVELDHEAKRVMCVLDPIKVVLKNVDENLDMNVEIPNHPKRSELGTCSMICVSFRE